jgi:erythronate-4-phosphate dehydrogenase
VKLRILADENIPAAEHYLGALGSVRLCNGRAVTAAQLSDIDVLLVRSVTRVDAQLLQTSPVKFVGTATSGFDHIDRDFLAARAIGFAYAPGSNANSVVEYVLAAVAAIADKLEQLLEGGAMGIVGYGNIGKALAARLERLGIRFRIHDPWLDQRTVPQAGTLESVLECDVVSLHPELTSAQPWPSVHLLGERELQILRPGAVLINASRGPVVDNRALLKQLQCGHGSRTVLDVWEGEPQVDANLLTLVTLGSAHIAGYSLDGKVLATRMLRDALCEHLRLNVPGVGSSLASTEPLLVPAALRGAALIRFLVQSRYDIRMDDALLREAVALGAADSTPGKRFDVLRRTYRDRRELAGSVISGDGLTADQLQVVRALGCVVAEAGTAG